MLRYLPTNKFCIYEILKYAELQALESELYEAASAEQKPNKSRTKAEQKPTNKNDNNDNTLKEIINNYTVCSDLKQRIFDFLEHRKIKKEPISTEKQIVFFLKKLTKYGKTNEEKIEILENSIANGWQGIFELNNKSTNKPQNKPPQQGNFDQRPPPTEEELEKFYKI
jgi:hypothetical protein